LSSSSLDEHNKLLHCLFTVYDLAPRFLNLNDEFSFSGDPVRKSCPHEFELG